MTRGGILVNDAFGGGAVDDGSGGFDLTVFHGFLGFGFDASFDDLIHKLLFHGLAQALFGRG